MKIMLPTAMVASQAMASDKKSCLQRLMIDICSSRFAIERRTREAGQTLHYVLLALLQEKTPAKKTSGRRLGNVPVQQGEGWSGYRH
ncbi:hypothetical protein [Pseudomonas izuensis]|uniref:hypothetical protein n=1 Tax=Pseudomonas izuensis TaxID=2684212 RepID=UPI0015B419D8|nr:hypothetical protein [Pseudomonas izuensis]